MRSLVDQECVRDRILIYPSVVIGSQRAVKETRHGKGDRCYTITVERY